MFYLHCCHLAVFVFPPIIPTPLCFSSYCWLAVTFTLPTFQALVLLLTSIMVRKKKKLSGYRELTQSPRRRRHKKLLKTSQERENTPSALHQEDDEHQLPPSSSWGEWVQRSLNILHCSLSGRKEKLTSCRLIVSVISWTSEQVLPWDILTEKTVAKQQLDPRATPLRTPH